MSAAPAIAPSAGESAWLARRAHAWGASEMPLVLCALGRRDPATLPTYAQQAIRPMKRKFPGISRLWLAKAGLVPKLAAGPAAKIGQARERELLAHWIGALESRAFALPEETIVDPASVRHADSAPRQWYPLLARSSPYIAATPDGWCFGDEGELFDVELKTTTDDVPECRWQWVAQVQAQGMATGSDGAFVVAGPRWARDEDRRDDGAIVRCFIAPDEALRRELVEAAAEAWGEVLRVWALFGEPSMPKEEADDNADASE